MYLLRFSANMQTLTYEEQRQRKIAKNRQVLQELGLTQALPSQRFQKQRVSERKHARSSKQVVAGERKSTRLRHVPPEVSIISEVQLDYPARREPVQPRYSFAYVMRFFPEQVVIT